MYVYDDIGLFYLQLIDYFIFLNRSVSHLHYYAGRPNASFTLKSDPGLLIIRSSICNMQLIKSTDLLELSSKTTTKKRSFSVRLHP